MSLELVLFLVVFLLLPLLQHLLDGARARQAPEPVQPSGRKASAGTHPSAGVPPLRERQFQEQEDRTLTGVAAAPERKQARDTHRPLTPPIGRSRRRGKAIVGLRNALDLRRAVVLQAVLGPCRANRPPDWPDGAAPR